MAEEDLVMTLKVEELKALIRTCVRKEMSGQYKKEVDEKLISAMELRNMFQPVLSKSTLSRWEKQGLLPSRKILGTRYYKRSEVMAVIEGRQKRKRSQSQLLSSLN